MGQADWQVPRTEEDLQQVLRRLAECRVAGDPAEVGHGLLELAFLVKWVRSDTAAPPFVRSHELAWEALDAFRRAGHVDGQIRALIAATAMADPQTREVLLAEAEALSQTTGNENHLALVLAARARGLALIDRTQSTAMHRKALEIFRRTGNRRGQAQALFSLAIGEATWEEKRDFAQESARLYRELGDRSEAARCLTIALMNAEEHQPLAQSRALAQEGLEDALASGDRLQEGSFYDKLARYALATGQVEESERYRRWASEIQDADGLTPRERWENDVAMTKTMIAMAKTQGNREIERTFRAELKRLKANRPKI